MDSRCQACDAQCCRYYCFEIDKPDSFEQFENIRWFLLHDKTTVHIDCDGDWYIRIDNICLNLAQTTHGPRCKDYANRPIVCRKFSPKTCEASRGDHDYEELFTTAQQLDAYAKRMLGDLAYNKGRAKMRAKNAKRTVTRQTKR
jgi:Fe-S-cluster containining protein